MSAHDPVTSDTPDLADDLGTREADCQCCSVVDTVALNDLLARVAAVTAERDEARAAVERVEAICEQDAASRRACAESDDCTCADKDCYECGKWHNCIHSPLTSIRAALAPASTSEEQA